MDRTRLGRASDTLVLACEHCPTALAWARLVTEQLEVLHPRLAVEVRPLRGALGGPRGVHTLAKALERDLADALVMPVETLPGTLPDATRVVAYCERLAPFQAFVSAQGALLDDLPPESRVGLLDDLTRFQLAGHRPELKPVLLRRGLDSGLRQVHNGHLEGVIAPVVDLELLGHQDLVTEVLDGSLFLPPVGRGAVALVSRRDHKRALRWLAPLDDLPTRQAVEAERALLAEMNGVLGLLAGLAQVGRKTVQIEAAIWSPDGQEMVRDSLTGEFESSDGLGRILAEKLLDLGGDRLVRRGRRNAGSERVPSSTPAGE
jgi:hydroxymethylbilane synthase